MLTRLIFVLTLFGSAFLSFSIQPILGKMLLPLVGGAPAAWIVAMAFFQIALLGGYALSHVLQRVTPLQHGLILLAFYLAGLSVLPAEINVIGDITQTSLAWTVLLLLTKTILLPFVALTATTSALLRMFSHTTQPTAQDPYYLFIASNAGSFIGLFIYPLLLEPFLSLDYLTHIWFAFYGLLIVCVIACLFLAQRDKTTVFAFTDTNLRNAAGSVTLKTKCLWFCLAFVPCCLSMSLSTMITTDIGNLPLIWTLPLGLYLLSFILGFARKPLIQSDTLQFMHIAAASTLFIFLSNYTRGYGLTLSFILLNLSVFFFIICWSCHQMLAAHRPAAQHLTLYYLIVAFGGAAAGVLNAFVFPVILDRVVEFPLTVVLSLCLPMIFYKVVLPPAIQGKNIFFYIVTGVVIVILMSLYSYHDNNSPNVMVYRAIARCLYGLGMFILVAQPRALLVACLATSCFYIASIDPGEKIYRQRNFFGSIVIAETQYGDVVLRTLRHGSTTHGMAEYDKNGQPTGKTALGYYLPNGPLGDIYNLVMPKRAAILGLGSGQLACFSPTAKTTYFEIDPDMVDVAENYFPYLKKCPVENIVLGDARLELAKQRNPYDLLVLDVFSSDSIPTHIMTHEAITMYLQHLNPHGLMLFHISNRYLWLAPEIAANVGQSGLKAYTVIFRPKITNVRFAMASQWVAVPLNPADGEVLLHKGWRPVDPGRTPVWTDQRSSLLTSIRPIANHLSVTQDGARDEDPKGQ